MIFLPCDEAFAFDYLSILYVKRDRGLAVSAEIERVELVLRHQTRRMKAILASREFAALVAANAATFDAVSKAGMTLVQRANFKRFRAKQRFQKRFFKVPLVEQKRPHGT